MEGFADWDPFTDASDALQGRTTEYEDDGGPSQPEGLGSSADAAWDPFEDHELLELTGAIAMESDDLEAIEAWIQQAKFAKLPRDKVQLKEDRLEALRASRQEEQQRKDSLDRLEKALRGDDVAALSEAISGASQAGCLKPREAERAAERLAELRRSEAERTRQCELEEERRQAQELEALAASAKEKLGRKRLVPSSELELSEQEKAALEREHYKENVAPFQQGSGRRLGQAGLLEFGVRLAFPDGTWEELQVNPCENGSSILLKLMPMKRHRCFPENLALFLPSGKALDFHCPLQAQGVCGGCVLRVDEASLGAAAASTLKAAPRPLEREEEPLQDDIDEEQFRREVEVGWNLFYWPLCVALAPFKEGRQALRKHPQVVVLGWDASHDLEVMQLSREISWNVSSDFLVVTGSEQPPEEWWPTAEEEATLASAAAGAAAARAPSLRGSVANASKVPGTLPKTSILRLNRHGSAEELGPAILGGLQEAGCGSSFALLVVSRAFQSRRPVSILNWCLQREEFSSLRVTVLPYSWDPRFVYLEDCRLRGDDVLIEAQLLTEMNPTVWVDEEGQEAEVALSRLLLAHPTPPRQHWHDGFYSKPFKEKARQAREGGSWGSGHCEWFRWQRSAPLSSAARAKAAAAAQGAAGPVKVVPVRSPSAVPVDEDEDDEEPPPLVSHE